MDRDFHSRTNSPYDFHLPPYARSPSVAAAAAAAAAAASPMYPRVGQPGQRLVPPVAGPSPHHHQPPSSTPSSGVGIRVAIKPEYRISPPPQLAPVVADVPHCTFQFDFDFERKVLAEAGKDNQNWDKIAEIQSPKVRESVSSLGAAQSGDPTINKYIGSGLGREAVTLAVANYGDNPSKVREFVNAYNLLREMGFSSTNVAEVLAMYDNDTDKALAHFLNSSS